MTATERQTGKAPDVTSFQPGDRVYACQGPDQYGPRTVEAEIISHPDGTVTFRVRDCRDRTLPLHESMLRLTDPTQGRHH